MNSPGSSFDFDGFRNAWRKRGENTPDSCARNGQVVNTLLSQFQSLYKACTAEADASVELLGFLEGRIQSAIETRTGVVSFFITSTELAKLYEIHKGQQGLRHLLSIFEKEVESEIAECETSGSTTLTVAQIRERFTEFRVRMINPLLREIARLSK